MEGDYMVDISDDVREFLKAQLQLSEDIMDDLIDYEPEEPVYAVYQYFPEIDAIGIGDYWYAEEPYVDEPEVEKLDEDEAMESTRLLMEHYEELEYLKKEVKLKMTLLELNIAHTEQLKEIIQILENDEKTGDITS